MSKDEATLDTAASTVVFVEPLAIIFNGGAEDLPFDTTDQSSFSPGFVLALISAQYLLVKILDDLLASVDPFIPILPYEWPFVSFSLQ